MYSPYSSATLLVIGAVTCSRKAFFNAFSRSKSSFSDSFDTGFSVDAFPTISEIVSWRVLSLKIFSPNKSDAVPMTSSSGSSTSPSSLRFSLSPVSGVIPASGPGSFAGVICLIISMTSSGARNTFDIFWKRKSLMKPRRTTSLDLIFLGMERTCAASRRIISPFSSSPITGKKFISSRILSSRISESPRPPNVSEDRSFANFSKMIRVLAGSKSNTYAFCFLKH